MRWFLHNPSRGFLSDKNPELLEEWDFDKNLSLHPSLITTGSRKKVWWVCRDCSHTWEATVKSRTRGNGCPRCARLRQGPAIEAPLPQYLLDEWDHVKNRIGFEGYPQSKKGLPVWPLSPADVTGGSGFNVWWVCNKGHSWHAPITNRVKTGRLRTKTHSKCPACKSLPTLPESLLSEWDFERNIEGYGGYPCSRHKKLWPLTPDGLSEGSGYNVWWVCKRCEHRWHASIRNRARKKTGCPKCERPGYGEGGKNRKKKFEPTQKGASRRHPRRSTRGGSRFDIGPRRPRRRWNPRGRGAHTHRKKTTELVESQSARDFIRQNFTACDDCQPIAVVVEGRWGLCGPLYERRRTKNVDSWRQFFNHVVLDHAIPLDLLALAFNVYPKTIHIYAVIQPFSAGTAFIKKLTYMFGSDLIRLVGGTYCNASKLRRWRDVLSDLDKSRARRCL